MIAYIISMSRYNVAADNVLRCGQAVIYPCINSCRIKEICILYVLGTGEVGDTQIIVIDKIIEYTRVFIKSG